MVLPNPRLLQALKLSANALPASDPDGSPPGVDTNPANAAVAPLQDTQAKLAALLASLARLQQIRAGLTVIQAARTTDNYVQQSYDALAAVRTTALELTGTDVPAITAALHGMQSSYDGAQPALAGLLSRVDHISSRVVELGDLTAKVQLLRDAKVRQAGALATLPSCTGLHARALGTGHKVWLVRRQPAVVASFKQAMPAAGRAGCQPPGRDGH